MEMVSVLGAAAVEMKIDLRQDGAGWRVAIEREGRRYEVGGLDELIRYLEWLAVTARAPAPGLR